jgi:hypothetical protein
MAVLALSGVDSKDENNTPVGAKFIRRTFNMESIPTTIINSSCECAPGAGYLCTHINYEQIASLIPPSRTKHSGTEPNRLLVVRYRVVAVV